MNAGGTWARLVAVADDVPVLTLTNALAWSAWLGEHGTGSNGVWLVLAKKGTKEPTTLTYEEALEEAICHGWIDGQLAKGDGGTFRRKFTPRRPASAWSKRNVQLANRLIAEGRMAPAGLAAVDRARTEERWESAYEGQATIEVPPDLVAALAANAAAKAMFEQLNAANRYAILYRLATAKRRETRQRRMEQFIAMLSRGETIHPQPQAPSGG